MMKATKTLLSISLALCLCQAFGAEIAAGKDGPAPRSFIDHLETRRSYLSSLLTSKPAIALAFQDAQDRSGGQTTNVFVLPGGETFSVVFSANPRDGERMPGDYLVRRNAKTSYLVDITVVLSRGGADYLVLRSLDSGRTALDLVAGGKKAKEGVALGIPLYYFLVRPFGDIVDLAGSRVPWSQVAALAP